MHFSLVTIAHTPTQEFYYHNDGILVRQLVGCLRKIC